MNHLLTTVDNPYDPFDNWDEWYAYDVRSGHHSSSLVARIAMVDDDLSDEMINESISQAIDSIIHENFNGLYMKVSRDIK